MVLWSRLRQSRFMFHAFSGGSRRFHSLNPAPVLANQHISSRKLVPILNYSKFIVQDEQLVLFRQVRFRFFARAVKVRRVERDENEPRLNEEITAPMVRLVIDEDSHRVIPMHEALARARNLDMDLVEVNRSAEPPVVKIFDYNKQKYIVQSKEKERSKSKVALKSGPPKDIIFRGKITESDLKVKANDAIRLMEKGYRVKCIAEDKAESSDLKGLLSKFTALIRGVAVYESGVNCDPKRAFIIARHIKFGPAKKGKKASVSAATSTSASTDSDSQDGSEIEDGETGQPLESSMEKETVYSDPRPASNNPGPGQRVEAPARGTPQQDSPKPTPPITYGIFSTEKVNGAASTMNPPPTFPNQGRLGNNASPQARPEARAHGTREQNSQPPFPNQGRPGNIFASPPARGIPKQGSSDPTPPKSYGIFSAPKVDAADSRTKGEVGGENPGQAKYGIFSEKPAQRR